MGGIVVPDKKNEHFMNRLTPIVVVAAALLLHACKPSAPVVFRGLPKEYNLAYEELYGRCYDSVTHAVAALDLYSEGLELDKNHRMTGSGYNLYLSDIFLPDRTGSDSLRMAAGTYRSDTTAEPFTFLPGRDYEGMPHGMYLLHIEDGKVTGIQVLDSGFVTLRDTTDGMTDLRFTLYYRNTYGSRATYEPHFMGPLIPWRKYTL
jgi:hypothetical protein